MNIKEQLKLFPILSRERIYMILHTDLDGLLSGLIEHNYKGTIPAGFYNLKTIWMDKNFFNLDKKTQLNILYNQSIFIDLDITYKKIFSIGHHIMDKDEKHLNPNLLLKKYEKEFKRKFPLNMAIFLIWIYRLELPKSDLGKLLLLQGDNVWKNYYGNKDKDNKNYRDNVVWWLQQMELYELLEFLEEKDRGLEIEREIHPLLKKYIHPKRHKENYQCSFKVTDNVLVFEEPRGNIQDLLNEMADILGVKRMLLPQRLNELISFETEDIVKEKVNEVTGKKEKEKIYIRKELDNMISKIKEKYRVEKGQIVEVFIFSYSLVYFHKLKVTYWIKEIKSKENLLC